MQEFTDGVFKVPEEYIKYSEINCLDHINGEWVILPALKVNEDGFYCGYSENGTIPINEEFNLDNLPTECHKWNGTEWVLDLDKAKTEKLEEMRACRSACWQKFDGLYLSCERDLKQDPTNVDLIAKLTACESLRQCLKDLPETVQTALDNATTLEDVQAINFACCLTIPTEIADEVNSYLL